MAHVSGFGVGHRRVVALVAAAHRHGAAARVTSGQYLPAEQADMPPGHGDLATGLARTQARGVQGTAQVDRAAVHVAQQQNAAVLAGDEGLRLDHAGVVHRAAQQAAGRLGRQQNLAAVRLNKTAVLRQRVHRTLLHLDLEQAVARHIQRHGAACGEGYRTALRGDLAVVAHLGTQQHHVTAVGPNVALVEHRAGAVADEAVATGRKVGVGDVEGGRDQAAHIDRRALAKQDAVRVDQEHLAVGRQAAQNAGRVGTHHPVQGHRLAVGLHKAHRFARCDVEALPVEGGLLAGLVDGGGARRGADAGGTRRHHAADRPGQGVAPQEHRHPQGQCLQGQAVCAAAKRGLRGLPCHRHTGAGGLMRGGSGGTVHAFTTVHEVTPTVLKFLRTQHRCATTGNGLASQ